MQLILYMTFVCYLLPLAGMIASAITSNMFQTDASLVTMTAAMSATFLESVRTGLGTLLIPLVTAYAVELRHPGDDIPREKKMFIVFLFTVFILSFGLNGIVLSNQVRLIEFSPQVLEAFKSTSILYTRELLGFISIAVVVTKMRGPRGKTPISKIGTRL
jgi:hypothetical protein